MDVKELKQLKREAIEALDEQREAKYMLIGQIMFYQELHEKGEKKS